MSLRINDQAPNFQAETTQGNWAVLFSHPKNFTPVCTTELGYMASIKDEFDKRNTKIIGLSIDPVAEHHEWLKDVEDVSGASVSYPVIADTDLNVAKLYN